MGWRRAELKERSKDWIATKIAWALPRRVVGWAFIRVWVYATTGRYGSEDGTAIRAVDALQRFGKPNDTADRRP